MRINSFLKNVGIILCLGSFLVGCTPNDNSSGNVSLDFLVTPEQLRIHSDSQLKQLNEVEKEVIASTESMNEKYDDLSKMSEEDIKIQEDIVKKLEEVLDSGKTIENKSAIENIFDQLRSLEGVQVDSFKEKVETRIELIEDQETESVVSSNNAYLRMFMVLEDGNMIIPKSLMSESSNGLKPTGELEYIKVKLPEKLRDELEKLAKD